jgi:plasmid stability protein
MPSVTIRDVPDDARDALAARAAASGQSMQEYLRGRLIDLAFRPSSREVVVELRERARAYPSLDHDALLADIDADRR